jgi:hypothetical protein
MKMLQSIEIFGQEKISLEYRKILLNSALIAII